MKLLIHTDGGARGNPGPAGAGVSIVDADTKQEIEAHAEYLGKTTNNQAEYRAVILGLERALALGAESVEVVTDSELLVKQAKGEYKVKNPDIGKRFLEMKNLCTQLGRVTFRHVKREYNTRADELSNIAMDKAGKIR
jgi:ribonuclease HI